MIIRFLVFLVMIAVFITATMMLLKDIGDNRKKIDKIDKNNRY